MTKSRIVPDSIRVIGEVRLDCIILRCQGWRCGRNTSSSHGLFDTTILTCADGLLFEPHQLSVASMDFRRINSDSVRPTEYILIIIYQTAEVDVTGFLHRCTPPSKASAAGNGG